MTAYLIKTSNAEDFFKAIRNAKAPERFTQTFLKNLDFATSNHRLYVGVLKGLRFLDDNGVPTERYFAFLDQSQSDVVLAEAIREAYEDLFAINREANKMSIEEVEGKFRTLTRGSKSDNVIGWMAATFRTLCDLADWSPLAQPTTTIDLTSPSPVPPEHKLDEKKTDTEQSHYTSIVYPTSIALQHPTDSAHSRDPAVYDALFSSLRRHLL